jgi:hypothetical protein
LIAVPNHRRQRDVLSLPLPVLSSVVKWLELVSSFKGNQRRQQKAKHALEACNNVWSWLVVFALNYEYAGGLISLAVGGYGSVTAAQQASLLGCMML